MAQRNRKSKMTATRRSWDSVVKEALKRWPLQSRDLWPIPRAEGAWLRAQPTNGSTVGPRLKAAGTDTFKIQPDGLWVYLSLKDGFADCVAIEGCSSAANFADKRSRYGPSTTANVVLIRKAWLAGCPSGKGDARWQRCHGFTEEPQVDIELPARFVRVLFFLKNDLYTKWRPIGVPAAHEFVASYKSINSYTSQKMQDFVRRMSPEKHFYTSA